MNLARWDRVRLIDICDIERAKAKKVYPGGSVLIPLSACSSTPIAYIEEPQRVEVRYAVATPKNDIAKRYLFYTVESEWEKFKAKYLTTINMQYSALRFYEVNLHRDKECQQFVVDILEKIQKEIELYCRLLEVLNEIKRYYLAVVFPF